MLEYRGLTLRYPGGGGVEGIDLCLERGRTSVLIGPSGCGKSTLLRLAIGLVQPQRGAVLLDGATVTAASVQDLRLRTGYVIQEGGLFPHLSARDNVELMARHLGRAQEETRARTRELAALVRLEEDLLERFPAQLSGGQRQRVGLMRALHLDPDLLLLDEPLGALDPMIRADLQDDLAGIFQSRAKTTLLVTHDLAEARALGDEVVLLREGRIVQRGTSRDLEQHPAEPFVEAFVRAQARGREERT